LIACNVAARSSGVVAGMDAPSSLMREPDLRLLDRSKADERRALHAIAGWAHQFTSDVCLDFARWIVWMEVGSSLRYFNGLSSLYGRIGQGIAGLGYTAATGVAPTLESAALLARHPQQLPILDRSELRAALGPLDLAGLDMDAQVLDQLHTAGLR